ncbi:MAG: TonB-dependent receptor plug domain-containing protein [Desulfobacteraceae bacterium]|jgi:outer membrane cobalamin receptor
MKSTALIILFLLTAVTPLKAEESAVISDKERINVLEPVIVREYRIEERKNIEKTGTTTEISDTDIEEKSAKVLKDVLYQVPGIQVSTQRKGTTQFTMRGYDMSKVAMLVDGIPLIETYDGSMDIDNIGLLDISEIVISRGTTSALYGTRGSAGSINLMTRQPDKPHTDVAAEFGEHGNTVASVSNGAPVGRFYYNLSALYDKSNGYEVSGKLDRAKREHWLKKLSRYDLYGFTLDDIYSHPGSSAAVYYLNDMGLWDHTDHEKYKFNSKIGFNASPELEIGVTSFYNITEMKNSSYFTDMRSMYTYNSYTGEKDWRLPDTTYILRNRSNLWPEYNDFAVSPFVNYRGDGFTLKGNAFHYEQSNKYLAYDDPLENVLAFNRDEVTMTWSIWTSRTTGFNLYPSFELAPWNTLNLALSYYTSSHREEEQAYNAQSTETLEGYGPGKYETMTIEATYLTLAAEEELKLRENTTLTLGVSFDAQDLQQFQKKLAISGSREMVDQYQAEDDSMIWGTRDAINPVAGILYEPVKDFLTLRASASRKTAFPTLRAYSKTLSPYQESSDLGSRDIKIKPEQITNANAGAKFSLFDGGLLWGADYFFSRFDDKITSIYITKSDDYIYRNIDSATTHGAEMSLDFYLSDVFHMADISVLSTYTFMISRNEADVDDSFVNKGDRFEKLPEQKITLDIRAHFKTDTSLYIFGNMEFNQIQYVMDSVPATGADFSTAYFYAQKLHDPIKIDVKLAQKLSDRYEVYVMCQNILDDYNADPFNPGAGRSWYAGFKAGF